MAGESIVGALRVILGLDTASLEDGTKKAASSFDSFGKQMLAIAGGIKLEKLFDKITDSFTHFATAGIETADNLGKMAPKIGIPVEQLSGLQLAAKTSDTSLETLGRGVKNLSVELVKAAAGGASEATSAIAALGIKIKGTSGEIRPMNDILLDLADKFSKMENGETKVALASALFGKKLGGELIPFLNQGKVGIVEMIVQAEKLGLVISGETAEAATKFNDNLKILNMAFTGVSLQLTAALAPALEMASQKMLDFVNKSDLAKKAGEILIRTIILIADNFKIVEVAAAAFLARLSVTLLIQFVTGLISFATGIATAAKGLLLFNATSLISLARITAMAAVVLYFTGQLPAFTEGINNLADAMVKMLPTNLQKTITDGLTGIGLDTKALTEELAKLTEGTKKHNDNPIKPPKFDPNAAAEAKKFNEEILKLQLQTRATNQEFAGLAPNFVQTAQSLNLIKASGEGLKQTLALATPEAIKLNLALSELKAAQLTQENLSPYDQYIQKLQEINQLQLTTGISADVTSRAQLKAATALRDAYGQVALSITGNLASAFKDLAGMNKQYAGIAKAAAIAQATVQTYVAANAAFAQGSLINPFFGYAAMAAAIAAGLVNVAKISATQFAQGGSFKVGGAGGIDSQLITMRATPGEMVDVRKPGQTTGPASEITVNMRGRDLISRDMLRDLFSALNDGIRDGYRLKLAEA